MHVHILGICGTFMGGIAALARARGHHVSGSDQNVYPPMSDQLQGMGVELIEGYDPKQLELRPDVVVIGNVMSRGNALIEALLDSEMPYTSGPEWLARHVLAGRWVLAVAGTHGKTTTSSLLAWLLEHAGLDPGFLIGGVPSNFATTARLGSGTHFVVEADEYDTAFFDKRAKFVHYRPRTAILNNLEHDHADIYPHLASIQWQFHQLMRMVPRKGLVVANGEDANVEHVIKMGCWTPLQRFSTARATSRTAGEAARVTPSGDGGAAHEGKPAAAGGRSNDEWRAQAEADGDYSKFTIFRGARRVGEVAWSMLGRHNMENGLAAFIAARDAGVPEETALEGLRRFAGVRRRMEIRGEVGGVTVYDDFAHHPTAVQTTIDGLRRRLGPGRLIAVFEPRSNTMKLGTHSDALVNSLMGADRVWLYQPPELKWDVKTATASLGSKASIATTVDELAGALSAEARAGDHVLIMSNGSFGGLHTKLLERLRAR
jgi:UDP-N-acetylmuramate: L-alanyl-gamma-D-glutamyl-meso-diaminopimelate ligase